MRALSEIDQLLANIEGELQRLDTRRVELAVEVASLKHERAAILLTQAAQGPKALLGALDNLSSQETKVALFRSLFRGREDVYARRFESLKTGKKGYQPVCRNEWVSGICNKPKMRCDECRHRDFLPVTDEVVRNHLLGGDPKGPPGRDFTMGVYPMLPDETCWFLAADFDKTSWMEDVRAFLETGGLRQVPVALERSRSGNGGHCWIFFAEPIPAALARRMGALLLTRTMEQRPEMGLDSYDRFFPSQDTLPRGGLGNLIALPLQRRPREIGNSVFLDESAVPYPDQWAFLSSIRRITLQEVETVVAEAERHGEWLGVRLPITDENDAHPWALPPSGQQKELPVVGPVPEWLEVVLGNQIYVPKADLSPSLRNRLIRLAAFQNPEFYRAQAMRLSTFGKPRIISCCEDYPKHLGLPRGCLDELQELLRHHQINVHIRDQRLTGTTLEVRFRGALLPEQQQAADALAQHDIGVLAAATAFGKTVVAAYLVAQRKVNTLVIVHRRQLLDQWVAALHQFLGLAPQDIGQVGGGKHKPSGKIDVAMIQSLSQSGVVDDIVGDYGYVIVDECHHVSAVSFERVVGQCKARYITGLSATVTRKDGHQPIIFMQCGPIRYRVDDRRQTEKRPFEHKVVVRQTQFCLPPHLQSAATLPIQDLYALLARDDDRNQMIVEDVAAAVQAGRSPVLLTERREHLELLADKLSARVETLVVMKGGLGKKQRSQLALQIASIPAERPRLLLATGRYLGEGFDDERLDTLFLALPISWRGTLTQYAGRLHRLNSVKKQVTIYDYVDNEVPVLVRMFDKRRAGYRAIGYEIGESRVEKQALQLSF